MFPNFLHQPADTAAKRLLGCFLERIIDGQKILVRIVETEAYDQEDAASHSFKDQTTRNEVMFREAGHLYVYFTYGMHYCANVVTGKAGEGSAVLIRAVEPIEGGEIIEERRGVEGVGATNGPAKLCQALAIDKSLNGHDLGRSPLKLIEGELRLGETVTQTKRIGITKDADKLRRFYITDNPFISRR
jgi:DNA-3-methyladenine glycosylase